MPELKTNEVDSFLSAKADPSVAAVLVFGPDHGLVRERATRIANASGIDRNDPFSTVMLDGDALDAAPDRLLSEVWTVPMFGGRRLIWVRDTSARRDLYDQIKAILADPPPDTTIIIEAGDIKKGAGLRTLASARNFVALPCYADDERALSRLVDETFAKSGLKLELDARRFLLAHLGGDRIASRTELEKVLLYCHGLTAITLDDVRAICGDSAAMRFDDATDAVMTGNVAALDTALTRFLAEGGAPAAMFSVLMRQFQQLDRMRATLENAGKSASAIVAAEKPPIFFTRRQSYERALAAWPSSALRAALRKIADAILEGRRTGSLDADILRMTLLSLTVQSARRQSQRR